MGDQALADMLRSLPDSPETLDRVVAAVFASSAQVPASAAAAADAAGTPLPLQVIQYTAVSRAVHGDKALTTSCVGRAVPCRGSGCSAEGCVFTRMCCPQMGARDRVVEALRSVFSRHGAVAATSAAMGLATDEVAEHCCPCCIPWPPAVCCLHCRVTVQQHETPGGAHSLAFKFGCCTCAHTGRQGGGAAAAGAVRGAAGAAARVAAAVRRLACPPGRHRRPG